MDTTSYILGSVLLVSFISLLGTFIISIQQKQLMKTLVFLVPLAVGALLGDVFFHLIPKSFESSNETTSTSALIILGIILFFFLEKFLRWHHHSVDIQCIQTEQVQPQKHLASLILISDGLHNFLDGIIIGVSYLVSIEVGIATTLAIIAHEIPQEIGDFGILIYAGFKRSTALLYNLLSALTAIAGAGLVLIFGSFSEQLIPKIIPFAAGVFIYIASSDLVPELHKHGKNKNLIPEIAGIGTGLLAMYMLLFLE